MRLIMLGIANHINFSANDKIIKEDGGHNLNKNFSLLNVNKQKCLKKIM